MTVITSFSSIVAVFRSRNRMRCTMFVDAWVSTLFIPIKVLHRHKLSTQLYIDYVYTYTCVLVTIIRNAGGGHASRDSISTK